MKIVQNKKMVLMLSCQILFSQLTVACEQNQLITHNRLDCFRQSPQAIEFEFLKHGPINSEEKATNAVYQWIVDQQQGLAALSGVHVVGLYNDFVTLQNNHHIGRGYWQIHLKILLNTKEIYLVGINGETYPILNQIPVVSEATDLKP